MLELAMTSTGCHQIPAILTEKPQHFTHLHQSRRLSVKGANVKGSYIALLRQGRLPVDRLLSGHLQLEEINSGFDRLVNGKAVRQVVMF